MSDDAPGGRPDAAGPRPGALLADESWAGATEAAGNARLAELRARAERAGGRAEIDESQADDLGGNLFDR